MCIYETRGLPKRPLDFFWCGSNPVLYDALPQRTQREAEKEATDLMLAAKGSKSAK
jgi:hypothetical protein